MSYPFLTPFPPFTTQSLAHCSCLGSVENESEMFISYHVPETARSWRERGARDTSLGRMVPPVSFTWLTCGRDNAG